MNRQPKPLRQILIAAVLLSALVIALLVVSRTGQRPVDPSSVDDEPAALGGSGRASDAWVPELTQTSAKIEPADSKPPRTIAVYLSVPSPQTVREWIPGSYLILGNFESIEPWERLPQRTAAFVVETLDRIHSRYGEHVDVLAPFTEAELSTIVDDALAIDATGGSATGRLVATTAVYLTFNLPTEHEEFDTATAKEAFRLWGKICESLAQDEPRLAPGLLSEYLLSCGFPQTNDPNEKIVERHADRMPVAPETYQFWRLALPYDGIVASDVHRRALAAIAQLSCDGCTGGGEANDVDPLDAHELALREAVRICAVDLGLEAGVRDLRVPDDVLRICVEAAGFDEASTLIVLLLEIDAPPRHEMIVVSE